MKILQQRQDLKCQPNRAGPTNSDIFYSQLKIGANPLKLTENFSFVIDKFSILMMLIVEYSDPASHPSDLINCNIAKLSVRAKERRYWPAVIKVYC